MTSLLSQCPIEDVLPWIPSSQGAGGKLEANGTAVLLTDCVETSGRFLLFVTAASVFRQGNRVLWISFNGAYTVNLIQQGLKKIGCNLPGIEPSRVGAQAKTSQTPPAKFTDTSGRAAIWSVAPALIELITKSPNQTDLENFLRGIYREVKVWLEAENETDCTIMLDDVSTLADVVESRLVYALVHQIRNLANCRQASLLVRCSGDNDQTCFTDQPEFIGEARDEQPAKALNTAWESSLLELFDWIADVLPLQSGYTREAHGRLCLTPRLGTTAQTPVRYNYCCTDQAVFAIRLTPKKII